MLTLKQLDLRPASKIRVDLDNHQPTQKRIPSFVALGTSHFRPALFQFNVTTTHTVIFDPVHENQVKFDPHSKIRSILMSPHKNKVHFDLNNRNKYV